MNKKKVVLIFSDVFLGGGSTITSTTLSLFNPSVGVLSSSSAVC